MDEKVSDDERASAFEIILSIRENLLCFDCGTKNPKWASSNLGVNTKLYNICTF